MLDVYEFFCHSWEQNHFEEEKTWSRAARIDIDSPIMHQCFSNCPENNGSQFNILSWHLTWINTAVLYTEKATAKEKLNLLIWKLG